MRTVGFNGWRSIHRSRSFGLPVPHPYITESCRGGGGSGKREIGAT